MTSEHNRSVLSVRGIWGAIIRFVCFNEKCRLKCVSVKMRAATLYTIIFYKVTIKLIALNLAILFCYHSSLGQPGQFLDIMQIVGCRDE